MKKYRILEKDEVIRAGDEIDRCRDTWREDAVWKPVRPAEIGRSAPDPAFPSHRAYRRPVPTGLVCFLRRLTAFFAACLAVVRRAHRAEHLEPDNERSEH